MSTPVHFDSKIGAEFLRYARLVANRGYVHNTLGNMVIRAPHPDHEHGVAYTKHAEVSLEEMGMENIVITEIETSRLLYGSRTTSIGHNLNREILRLRPDIGAVIHVHDDATIAFFGSGAFREVKVLSLDMPFILGRPPYYVPANVDVEADVGPVASFIAGTNLVVLLGHGITALGRTVSEAYHRLNSFTAEVRRNIEAERLAALKGTTPLYRSEAEIALMHRHAEAVIYPTRAEQVMREEKAA
ncbi:MAG TPA: class II aldolase/adducin family protein [Chloroflexota bacterium]|nr:class II aldolase/adducin family protein [Chloroflexota bacterium]